MSPRVAAPRTRGRVVISFTRCPQNTAYACPLADIPYARACSRLDPMSKRMSARERHRDCPSNDAEVEQERPMFDVIELAPEGPLARWVIVGCNVTEGRKVTPFLWAVLLVRAVIFAACTDRTADNGFDKEWPMQSLAQRPR
jgi:hypothetical protein